MARLILAVFLWSLGAGSALAQTTTFVSPAPGTTEVGADVRFEWSPVSDATAYYLYLGTTSGAKDVLNTGEVQYTSITVNDLPAGITLYARIWVKVDGVWRYSENVYQTLTEAKLVTPADGMTEVPLDVQFTWQEISGAQKYYLYVGRTPGAKDVVNSGETLATSFRAKTALPEGELLYARLWTRHDDAWHYTDSTFTSRALTARLTSPANGATSVHPQPTLAWTTVPSAVAYYVYLGTTVGAKDVMNSGELKVTQLRTRPLEGARHYYLRLWTRADNLWRYRDYEFSTRDFAAVLIPTSASTGNDPDLGVTWSAVAGAEKYSLQVGSAAGLSDLYKSGETTATSATARGLPGGQWVYLRLWTRINGAWKYEDSTTKTRAVPRFTAPRPGTIGFNGTAPFSWNRVADAQSYRLTVGTTLGGSDVFESESVEDTSLIVGGLPQSETLYARIYALVDGTTVHADTVLASKTSVRSSWMIKPAAGGQIAGPEVFAWAAVGVASGYRLTIGTTAGSIDLYDSGVVNVTFQRIEALPQGPVLYGRLTTYYPYDRAAYRDFTFTAGDLSMSDAQRLDWAVRFAGVTRQDAAGNDPRPLSMVQTIVRGLNQDRANCSRFSQAMLAMLAQARIGLQARLAGTCLVPNQYDCHTLVEILDPRDGRWVLTDPTFGLAPRRAVDDVPASLSDMADSARARNWSAINYQYLTAAGDQYARNYYLDYPTLFMQPLAPNQSTLLRGLVPVDDMYDTLGNVGSESEFGVYAVRCGSTTAAEPVIVDGVDQEPSCYPNLAVTRVFGAAEVELGSDSSAEASVLKPRRFEF